MRVIGAFALLALLGTTANAKMALRPPTTPAPAVSIGGVKVQMTAATLEEDCSGAGAPYPAPAPAPEAVPQIRRSERTKNAVDLERGCAQTSMQLSIVSENLEKPASVSVTKVEFFDESGKSLGELTPRAPMVWNATSGVYEAWDQKIGDAQNLSVSYSLSTPPWDKLPRRWGQTFVMKAAIAIGEKNETVQRDVQTQTRLPPGVKT